MHVVVVGAGSVGQVYGYYLQQGGARVTYLVKEHHLPRAQGGLTLYPWNRRNRTEPVHWTGYDLATTQEQALADDPDVVMLATSTTALLTGTWFDALADRLGDSTLVSLQPGTSVPRYIHDRVPAEQVVWGLISVSAWPAPLPGQDLPEPGQAWWVPWASKLGFSGPAGRTRAVVDAMQAGGAPAAVRDDIHADQAFMGPVLSNLVIPLELSGWSVERLAADDALLDLAHRCMQECWAWAEVKTGKRTPFVQRNLGVGRLRFLLTCLLPRAPLDMETFFRVHYTKVADQTPVLLAQRIADVQAAGCPTDALEALQARLLDARGDTPSVASGVS